MDVLCIGEALVDFVSREHGEALETATQYTAATGGAPANVAAGLAKLGRQTQLIATVGDDAFGRKILHDLESLGVECALRIDPDHFTTLAFVRQGKAGQRDFEFCAGAHDYLLPDQVTEEAVRSARVLHYGSVSMRAPQSREATLKAIRIAKSAGVLTSCDPNWRPHLWRDQDAGRAAMREAIAHADLLKISRGDLAFLASEHGDNYTVALASLGFAGAGYRDLGDARGTRSGRAGVVPSPRYRLLRRPARAARSPLLDACSARPAVEALDDETARIVQRCRQA